MKKYTCPDCGKVFLNRRPKSCPQCGCVSENFVVSELQVDMGSAQETVSQATQPIQQQFIQPAAQPQTQYVVQPVTTQVSLEGFMNFLSVIILLAGIALGLYVLIQGCIAVSEANSAVQEYSYYRDAASTSRQSAAPAVLGGLFIILTGMVQFGLIRLFTKMSRHLESIETKMK